MFCLVFGIAAFSIQNCIDSCTPRLHQIFVNAFTFMFSQVKTNFHVRQSEWEQKNIWIPLWFWSAYEFLLGMHVFLLLCFSTFMSRKSVTWHKKSGITWACDEKSNLFDMSFCRELYSLLESLNFNCLTCLYKTLLKICLGV